MKRSRAAFTLVELLVVIAIIAVLIGLFFSLASKAVAKAHQTQSLSNMRQIATAFMLYAADNNGRLPSRPVDGDGSNRWPTLLDAYLKDTKVFVAPDDSSNKGMTPAQILSNSTNNTSYIMNSGLDPGRSDADAAAHPTVLAGVEQPSKTILVGLIFNDGNFFLDVAHGDQHLIKPYQFAGTSNDYVFMDGSAQAMAGKEYEKLNATNGSDAWLWLLDKDAGD